MKAIKNIVAYMIGRTDVTVNTPNQLIQRPIVKRTVTTEKTKTEIIE